MRVVVADDTFLTRSGVIKIVTDAGHEVVAELESADRVVELVDKLQPDALIVDIRMPPNNRDDGLVAAEAVRAAHPDVVVLVLSQYVEPRYALRLLGESGGGGCGYLLKDRVFSPAVLAEALERLADGECIVDPDIVEQLLARKREHNPLTDLTDREREVLSLVAEGKSNSAIASELFLSERTVETHTATIFQKLGLYQSGEVHRRVQAVLAFLRNLPT